MSVWCVLAPVGGLGVGRREGEEADFVIFAWDEVEVAVDDEHCVCVGQVLVVMLGWPERVERALFLVAVVGIALMALSSAIAFHIKYDGLHSPDVG